jgi:general secretion pathway protein G
MRLKVFADQHILKNRLPGVHGLPKHIGNHEKTGKGGCVRQMKTISIKANQGFTLIELLVVILILGLLIGIVGPRVIGRTDDAKVSAARIQIEGLSSALKMYKLDNGVYPSTEQGLQALVEPPQSGTVPRNWRQGGYLERRQIPKDPWGNDYVYLSPGVHDDFDLLSYGADGTPGGEGYNRDITSWELDQ